jgi:hypothetical protein
MKTAIKSMTIAACLTLFAAKVYGQEKVWSIGPEIGVNYSRYGMDADENNHVSGIAGGIFLTYSVVNTFGITGKILYAEKGADWGNREEILKYIEVPLLGRFFLNKEGRFRPNLFLGPSFGFLRSVSTRTGTNDPVRIRDFEHTFNKYDLGATAGLGLNYLILRETRLLLDGRYTYGLADITKRPGQINNETITLTFGLSFGI